MSTMPGNPHAWLLANGYATDTPEYAATCQIEATLALAYERRTANLIAAATATFADGSAMFPPISDQLREEITKRLVEVTK